MGLRGWGLKRSSIEALVDDPPFFLKCKDLGM